MSAKRETSLMPIMTPFLRLLEDFPGEIKQCYLSGVGLGLIKVAPCWHSTIVRVCYCACSIIVCVAALFAYSVEHVSRCLIAKLCQTSLVSCSVTPTVQTAEQREKAGH